jgi:hypothetical protein
LGNKGNKGNRGNKGICLISLNSLIFVHWRLHNDLSDADASQPHSTVARADSGGGDSGVRTGGIG